MNGGFYVQLRSPNPLGKVPVNQVTEETVDKDTKVSCGIKRFSMKSHLYLVPFLSHVGVLFCINPSIV